MQREFSKELVEDRQFEVGGELFEWTYPHWEQAANLFDEELKPDENGGFSFKGDTELAIQRVPIFLAGGATAKKKWTDLVKRKENPIPRHQIVEVYRWLVQVSSGLPTNPPSDLGSGGGNNDTSSPGDAS